MTDAELERLANLVAVLDDLEARGFFGSLAHAALATERDALLARAAGGASSEPEPEPEPEPVPRRAAGKKGIR